MKVLGVILIAILCMQPNASAALMNTTLGPFNISFDLNTTKTYVIQPQDTDTDIDDGISVVRYRIKIIDIGSPADSQVTINKYGSPILKSVEYSAEKVAELYRIIRYNITVDYRDIDGKQGYDVKGTDRETGRIYHSAGYHLDDKTPIAIIGDITEFDSLLNTIRINRVA